MLEDVEKSVALPLTVIAHMWNLDLGAQPQAPGDLDRAETLGCLSILHLVKAVVQTGCSPRLWLITRGAPA